MKNFERFAHEGVRKDLSQLKKNLSSDMRLKFGSSGEGELTIKGEEITVYARKFKQKDGWKLVKCHGVKILETLFPESNGAALTVAQKWLR